MWCEVELLPLSAGEVMPGVRDQFTLELVGEQLLQIDQLGDSRAYPDHPFCCCRLENFL